MICVLLNDYVIMSYVMYFNVSGLYLYLELCMYIYILLYLGIKSVFVIQSYANATLMLRACKDSHRACQERLSLSLGSSRCLPCPSHWPAVFVVILLYSCHHSRSLVGDCTVCSQHDSGCWTDKWLHLLC